MKNEKISLEITGDRFRKVIGQIERAKQEWEVTVDSLAELVCLLDNHGHIIRANRTIETWNLGQVLGIKGTEFHTLCHPTCTDQYCYLRTFLDQALEKVAKGEYTRYEGEDDILQRYLSIQVRPTSIQVERGGGETGSFAVLIVNDISESKKIENALKNRNHELSLLNDMSDLLQACSTEKETYNTVTIICQQLFPTDSGGLFLLDNTKTSLKMVDSWGTLPSRHHVFKADDCLAFQRNIIYTIGDPRSNPHLCPHLNDVPDGTYWCVPISTSNEILGILFLSCIHMASKTSKLQWKNFQLDSKRMVANRVAKHYALFLANLRLHQRDHLTGLYNRLYMEQTLQQEKRRVERRNTALFMLDIDHFKTFNDNYSYEAGDLVLRKLGAFLRSKIRSDDIACRYGGEEFLLILPESSQETASKRAEELRLGVKNLHVDYQGISLSVTISVGVATLPQNGPSIEDAVRAADTALHQAKARGRDRVVIASS